LLAAARRNFNYATETFVVLGVTCMSRRSGFVRAEHVRRHVDDDALLAAETLVS